MSRYGWNEKDLENDLKTLYNKLKHNLPSRDIDNIHYDIELLETMLCYDNSSNNTANLLKRYRNVYRIMNQYKFFWENIESFYQNGNFDELISTSINNVRYSIRDIEELSYAFFNSLNDSELLKTFMMTFKHKNNLIAFRKNDSSSTSRYGETFSLLYLKKNYIEIFLEESEEDIFTYIHENGHACASLLNPCNTFFEKSFYREVEGIYLELISADFLARETNNNNFLKHRYNDSLVRIDSLLDAYYVIDLIKALGPNPSNNSELRDNFMKGPRFLEDVINDYCSITDTSLVTNIGFLISMELYIIYLKDPEKSLYLFKKFLNSKKNDAKAYYDYFCNNGIFSGIYCNDFIDKIKTDVNKR